MWQDHLNWFSRSFIFSWQRLTSWWIYPLFPLFIEISYDIRCIIFPVTSKCWRWKWLCAFWFAGNSQIDGIPELPSEEYCKGTCRWFWTPRSCDTGSNRNAGCRRSLFTVRPVFWILKLRSKKEGCVLFWKLSSTSKNWFLWQNCGPLVRKNILYDFNEIVIALDSGVLLWDKCPAGLRANVQCLSKLALSWKHLLSFANQLPMKIRACLM